MIVKLRTGKPADYYRRKGALVGSVSKSTLKEIQRNAPELNLAPKERPPKENAPNEKGSKAKGRKEKGSMADNRKEKQVVVLDLIDLSRPAEVVVPAARFKSAVDICRKNGWCPEYYAYNRCYIYEECKKTLKHISFKHDTFAGISKTHLEVLSALMGDPEPSDMEIIRSHWV